MLYLHIPFCKSFCTYCDFYSELCSASGSEWVQKLFVQRVLREIDERRAEIDLCRDPRTLYVGGGTPSVLDASMLRTVVRHLDTAPYDEFTVEVNPEDIVVKGVDYVRELVGMGVNRVSMGIQSFNDDILRWMNRRHDSRRAEQAFRILREGGVNNISIDLIFGLSQLSERLWLETISRTLELAPEHISAYQLSIEEGSALKRMVLSGAYTEATDEQCRHQWDMLCDVLGQAGFHHYEVSNFARPGFEAVHNSAYWRRIPYVGLGPGAHSFDGSRRQWNTESISDYAPEYEILSPEDERVETIMLSLRTDRGLKLGEALDLCDKTKLERFLREGSLVLEDGCIRIPERRLFVSDEIIRELI